MATNKGKNKRDKRSKHKSVIKRVDTKSNTDPDSALELLKYRDNLLLEHSLNVDSRILTLSGDIEDGWFEYVDARLSILEEKNDKPITIRLFSGGGNTFEAAAVIGRMKTSKCKFIVEGYGSVMSAATLILAAGDTRKLSKYAWFMHHGPRWGTEGRHATIKEAVVQQEREDIEWNKWMGEFTKKDSTFWQKWAGHSDLYLSPEEALEYGVIDEII